VLNTILWIAQAFLALVMAMAGLVKLSRSREQLAERFHWAAAWPRGQIKLLGLAEVAGAIGLVAPVAAEIAPFLTPLAAACLCILMMGAACTHRQLGESFVFPIVLAALCLFVAAGRIAEHEAARPAIAEGRANSRGDDGGTPQEVRERRHGLRSRHRGSPDVQHVPTGTSLASGSQMEALGGEVVDDRELRRARAQRARHREPRPERARRVPAANTEKGESP